MKVGDLVKMTAGAFEPNYAEAYGLGLILEQPRKGSSTVLWQKDHQFMTTWDAWLEVINEGR